MMFAIFNRIPVFKIIEQIREWIIARVSYTGLSCKANWSWWCFRNGWTNWSLIVNGRSRFFIRSRYSAVISTERWTIYNYPDTGDWKAIDCHSDWKSFHYKKVAAFSKTSNIFYIVVILSVAEGPCQNVNPTPSVRSFLSTAFRPGWQNNNTKVLH